MYKIKPFLLQKIAEGYVLQNGLSTTVITNKELIDFLKDCEERHLKKVEYNYISVSAK